MLEIGPGGDPHPRSDILLELDSDEATLAAQRGYAQGLKTNKKVVYYDGKKIPFSDKEFDYVICSHVLEHVEDLRPFLLEMFRVAKNGYVEYPLAYYEYLYNFDVHLNILKFNKRTNTLHYLKKAGTTLDDFKPIQNFFLESLRKGYSDLITDLTPYLFEGFEWRRPFALKQTNNLRVLVPKELTLNLKVHSAPVVDSTDNREETPQVNFAFLSSKIRRIANKYRKGQ